jgi:hypothetical protein
MQQRIGCWQCAYRGIFQADIGAEAAQHRNGFLVEACNLNKCKYTAICGFSRVFMQLICL